MEKRAFTLVELLVTISIIGLLVAASSVYYGQVKSKSRDNDRKTDLLNLSVTLESFYAFNRYYPGGQAGCDNNVGTYDDYNYNSNCTIQPWIPNLESYMQPLPLETGPDKGDFTVIDNPCDTNDLRTYQYRVNSISPPTHYFLAARLENFGDPDVFHQEQVCPPTQAHNFTIAPGFTANVTGHPIYFLWK